MSPNAPFRETLARDADTWRLVAHEAVGNGLQTKAGRGRLLQNYPVALAVDDEQRVECTITGGLGYVPVTFHALSSHRGYEALLDGRTVHQAVHGNDFWQTGYDSAAGKWR